MTPPATCDLRPGQCNMLKNLVLLWHDLRGRPSSGRFGEPQALEEPSFLAHCDGFAPAV